VSSVMFDLLECLFVFSSLSIMIISLMADIESNGAAPVELSSSSNGQNSQTNLVEGRRSRKPRPNRTNQAESSLNSANNHPQEDGKLIIWDLMFFKVDYIFMENF
jgi:hypothetical protein